jgi:serine/threonine protein kinase
MVDFCELQRMAGEGSGVSGSHGPDASWEKLMRELAAARKREAALVKKERDVAQRERVLRHERILVKQLKREMMHEKLLGAKVSSFEGAELPQDFKIQSKEIQIGKEIGSGGFSTIHRCQWQNYDYAVKIFQATNLDVLRAEVHNLLLLPRHPNIVLLVGFSIRKEDNRPMIVMELLDGDLHSLVCSGEPKKTQSRSLAEKFSWFSKTLGKQLSPSTPIRAEAIDYIYQIAKGMLFLHNRKIFHGDLKGKNVLVKKLPGGRMQLKIADFGLSEKLLVRRKTTVDSDDDLNCSNHSDHSGLGIRQSDNGKAQVVGNVGTLRWMAPEVYGVEGGDMKPDCWTGLYWALFIFKIGFSSRATIYQC